MAGKNFPVTVCSVSSLLLKTINLCVLLFMVYHSSSLTRCTYCARVLFMSLETVSRHLLAWGVTHVLLQDKKSGIKPVLLMFT
jgi:hypothetical protein